MLLLLRDAGFLALLAFAVLLAALLLLAAGLERFGEALLPELPALLGAAAFLEFVDFAALLALLLREVALPALTTFGVLRAVALPEPLDFATTFPALRAFWPLRETAPPPLFALLLAFELLLAAVAPELAVLRELRAGALALLPAFAPLFTALLPVRRVDVGIENPPLVCASAMTHLPHTRKLKVCQGQNCSMAQTIIFPRNANPRLPVAIDSRSSTCNFEYQKKTDCYDKTCPRLPHRMVDPTRHSVGRIDSLAYAQVVAANLSCWLTPSDCFKKLPIMWRVVVARYRELQETVQSGQSLFNSSRQLIRLKTVRSSCCHKQEKAVTAPLLPAMNYEFLTEFYAGRIVWRQKAFSAKQT